MTTVTLPTHANPSRCIRCQSIPSLTADEAAAMIPHGASVGFSGFTPAGAAKAVPTAIAKRAIKLHEAGDPYQIRVLTGASTGSALDEALAQANAVSWRAPYQSSKTLRDRINKQEVEFLDLHLSHVPQMLEFGFIPELDFAVVEAVDVAFDGRVYLSTSGGISPSILHHAKKVIIEVNRFHSTRLSEMHDIKILPPPPHRSPIPIYHPLSRIGTSFATVDPRKIVGVIENDASDGVAPFSPPDQASRHIAGFVVQFMLDEMAAGRIPADFLPLQSGVGNIANAVLSQLGSAPDIPPFYMYSEVFQDACVDLMLNGRMLGASATSLTLSDPMIAQVYDQMDFFTRRIVLRPQELSNNPEVIRRLGVIAINTALEVDIYGHANSTHVCGTQLMNGIGGSGDFMRNAYLSIFVCPSIAKRGAISAIVPMCSHMDHNEHTVQVVVTEQGLADLRGLGPIERARKIIDTCAHPSYREYLHNYVNEGRGGHSRHTLGKCFDLHENFLRTGHMLGENAPA